MKIEISKNYMTRSGFYKPFYIVKETNDDGTKVTYYEGYSVIYGKLVAMEKNKEKETDTAKKCLSLNGNVIEKSPIYKTGSDDGTDRVTVTQFIHGLKMEDTFSACFSNDLEDYTAFSPANFDEFLSVLAIGKNYLRIPSADLFRDSDNGDQVIGIQYSDEYKNMPNDEDNKNSYKRVHRFMDKYGICYYLLMNMNGTYVPFLIREFDPMA